MTGSAPVLGPVTLEGDVVRLEPLQRGHIEALRAVTDDARIWRWLSADLRDRAALESFVDEAMANESEGREHPFAVVARSDGRVVGTTRYLNVEPRDRGVEIGWTWYAADVWGTSVNPDAKLLLLGHAFETWGARRVWFKTDACNERSRCAIVRLGARFEGVLRNHRIRPDGTMRHSAVYSILPDEWPAVRARLEARVAAWCAGAAAER